MLYAIVYHVVKRTVAKVDPSHISINVAASLHLILSLVYGRSMRTMNVNVTYKNGEEWRST